jgi:hypothetical protein
VKVTLISTLTLIDALKFIRTGMKSANAVQQSRQQAKFGLCCVPWSIAAHFCNHVHTPKKTAASKLINSRDIKQVADLAILIGLWEN